MPAMCIVCKKEPIPFDDSRSFHKFPMNDDLKTKWMNAIGKLSIKKSWRVCSDHFDAGSYHDTDGYTTLRRLLSNAVPRIISNEKVLPDVINEYTETSEKTESEYCRSTESHHNIIIKSEENEISQSEENTKVSEWIVNVDRANVICHSTVDNSNDKSDDAEADYTSLSNDPLEIDEHTPYKYLKICHDEIINQQHHQDNSGNSNHLKRKNAFENKANHTKIKKINYRSNFRTYRFSREKFSSDEAWEEFQEFFTCIKNKTAAAVKKNSRQQKKLTSLQMVIEKLKINNESAVAEYLQDG